jgi:hypothetical protein
LLIENGIDLFPNPAINVLNISNRNEVDVDIVIRSIMGAEVYIDDTNQSTVIDISNWQRGVYLVEIRAGEIIANKKIVVFD